MKVFSIFVLFAVLGLSIGDTTTNSAYSFADYVRQFNKSYDPTEYAKREAIFNANYKRIQDKINEPGATYRPEVNKFTDWTDDEKKNYMKYKPQNAKLSFSPRPLKSLGAELVTLPPIDYRTLGKVTPPKDQGACGSCWTFSTTGLYESLFLISEQTTYDLAE